MDQTGDLPGLLGNYLPVLLGTVVGFMLILSAVLGARLLAPFSEESGKGTTYECGMLPLRRASTNIGVRFYLYAILFVLFDVEAVFLFPWALTFVELGVAAYYEMLVFILVLGAGLGYAWKKGALQWR